MLTESHSGLGWKFTLTSRSKSESCSSARIWVNVTEQLAVQDIIRLHVSHVHYSVNRPATFSPSLKGRETYRARKATCRLMLCSYAFFILVILYRAIGGREPGDSLGGGVTPTWSGCQTNPLQGTSTPHTYFRKFGNVN